MKIRDILSREASSTPKISSVSKRLRQALSVRDITQSELARTSGVLKGAISNYVQGRYEPKADTLQKLASALNCSETWLLGYDVPMDIEYSADEENPLMLDVIDAFESLSLDNQYLAKNQIVALANNKKEPLAINGEKLSDAEVDLIELFRQVPEDRQQLVLQMIRVALGNRK